MAALHQYQVWEVRESCVIRVNGLWTGQTSSNAEGETVLVGPLVWNHLNDAGAAGWELVAVCSYTDNAGRPIAVLYLKQTETA